MPTYLNRPVSDEYLQSLIAAYRDGQRSVSDTAEEGDQAVIDRLESRVVTSANAPSAYDLGVADATAAAPSAS